MVGRRKPTNRCAALRHEVVTDKDLAKNNLVGWTSESVFFVDGLGGPSYNSGTYFSPNPKRPKTHQNIGLLDATLPKRGIGEIGRILSMRSETGFARTARNRQGLSNFSEKCVPPGRCPH